MTNYDFKILQPSEFECLARDVIQARDHVYIESFTDGRDGGIDFRYAITTNRSSVIQVKRYTDFSRLFAALKKEVEKVKKIIPKRYYIVTSVGLTPDNKTKIQMLFGEDILSTADIIGRDDLNNLLGLYPDIEKKYYKLWLSSTNVLESLLHKRIENWAAFEMDKIRKDIHQYVQNESFAKALEILNEHKYVIISGIPGIGKTTLARMLVYHLLAKGMESFVYIPADIDDAVEMFDEERSQVFFFDDFLGSTVFEKGERKFDQKILSFIDKVKHSQNKLFILTTREYILSDAMLYYEKFSQNKIDIAKCTLDMRFYSRPIKAAILYNHLADAKLPAEYVEVLLQEKNYNKLIDHTNYNPRVIETFIKDKIWENVPTAQFMKKILDFFDNPLNVWQGAFDKLDNSVRYILLVLATMPVPVRLCDWKLAFDHFKDMTRVQLGLFCDEKKWLDALRVLQNCFIQTELSGQEERTEIVRFFNPSVKDFISAYLIRHKDTCNLLIKGLMFTEQLYTLFCDTPRHRYYFMAGSSYVQLEGDQIRIFLETLQEVREKKMTCRLKKKMNSSSAVCPFDEFVFLYELQDHFPILCRDRDYVVNDHITTEMLSIHTYPVQNRMKLIASTNLSSKRDIDTLKVFEELVPDLRTIDDNLEFIKTTRVFDMDSILESDKYKEQLNDSILLEIDNAGTEFDLKLIQDDIVQLGKELPGHDIDYKDDIEDKRVRIIEEQEEGIDFDDDDNYRRPDIREEQIDEMFSCLRVTDES